MPIALLIAILMGGGVSFAAADTLPGDALYPVKIHVNENVESAFALSDSAKTKFESHLAVRRLEETEKLEAKQKLDTQIKAELKTSFDDHTAQVEARLKEIGSSNKKDTDQISSQFETSLRGHVNALELLGVRVTANDKAEISSDEHEAEGATTTSTSASPKAPKKQHADVLLNAVFRSNDSLKGEHEDASTSSSSDGAEQENAVDRQTGDQTDANNGEDTSARSSANASGSIQVNDLIQVNSDTNVELKNDDGAKSPIQLHSEGEGSHKIKLGL